MGHRHGKYGFCPQVNFQGWKANSHSSQEGKSALNCKFPQQFDYFPTKMDQV